MNYRRKLKQIKGLLFDVDGVFSPYFVAYDKGELYRIMNPKDGFAIRYALEQGFRIGIITGGVAVSVKERFELLGIKDVYLGSRETKLDKAKDFCKKYNLDLSEVMYMGDDLPDYEVMKAVGFSACPSDAAIEIQNIADYISDKKAGEGCVRDIVEQILKSQGKWFKI